MLYRSVAPVRPPARVRERMQAVGRSKTPGELLVAGALTRQGHKIALNVRPEPSLSITPDVVISKLRVCLFIDGCYWHGCPKHFVMPRANGLWWRTKIANNRTRDRRQARLLRSRGWHVWRIWEHSLQGAWASGTMRRLNCKLAAL
jgi:DNA mismatch endonuclease, patch repair protein